MTISGILAGCLIDNNFFTGKQIIELTKLESTASRELLSSTQSITWTMFRSVTKFLRSTVKKSKSVTSRI